MAKKIYKFLSKLKVPISVINLNLNERQYHSNDLQQATSKINPYISKQTKLTLIIKIKLQKISLKRITTKKTITKLWILVSKNIEQIWRIPLSLETKI